MDAVCGIYGANDPILVVKALVALGGIPNRGGYCTGIGIGCRNGIYIYTGNGKPSQVISAKELRNLAGYDPSAAIGYFGYAKYKDPNKNTEPLEVYQKGHSRFQVAVCMDGYILHSNQLKGELETDYRFITESQTEVFGALFHKYLTEVAGDEKNITEGLFAAGKKLIEKLDGRGTFSAPMLVYDGLTKETYLASLTDAKAFEPLCYGFSEEQPVIVSESNGLDMLRIPLTREFTGAEMSVKSSQEDFKIRRLQEGLLLPDRFHPIYFAAPSSTAQGREVYDDRKKIGRGNVTYWKDYNAEIAVPVEASGIGVTHGIADALGIRCEGGLVKNPHASRTFQDLEKITRALEVRLKFSVIKSIVQGKCVVTGDDSIVKASISEGVDLETLVGFEKNPEVTGLLYGGAIDALKQGGARLIEMGISYGPMSFPTFKEWEDGPDCIDRLGVHKLGKRFDTDPFSLTLEDINYYMAQMFVISKLRYTPFSVIKGVLGEGGSYQALNGSYPISDEWTPDFIKRLQDRFAQTDQNTLLG